MLGEEQASSEHTARELRQLPGSFDAAWKN